jgi:CRISPR-associated protein Csd1
MILQALYEYYDRLREDPDSGVALPGFAPQRISFAIVIDEKGQLVQIQDLREMSSKKPRPITLKVPEAAKKSVNIAANFLWGNSSYVLGFNTKDNADRTQKSFEAFKNLHHRIGDELHDKEMNAVLQFLDSWKPQKRSADFDWDGIIGFNLVFRLQEKLGFVHECTKIQKAWIKHGLISVNGREGRCLITGANTQIARLHNPIKGIYDPGGQAQKMLVSFNRDAFSSYAKEQNYNAPIGIEAAFAYTTALNHLLRFDSKQRVQIGDATTVFWTERSSPLEDFMGNILDPRKDSAVTAADAKRVNDYLTAVRKGTRPELAQDSDMRFYILGLAPNASRLAVRFWYTNSVEKVSEHLGKHFSDIEITKEYENQSEFPGLWQLLIETVRHHRKEGKPIDAETSPVIAAAFARAVIEALPYPNAILASLINRIRADGAINFQRMGLIKGILKRNYGNKEATMALNEECANAAYRLGRLFAVLEKAQEEAIPGANATIKDRFFGSASATPSIVFPQLIRLSQHHLAKLDGGSKIHKEQLIQSILDGIDPAEGLPSHLRLEDQGMFALGYYHQRKAFFTKKESKQPVA